MCLDVDGMGFGEMFWSFQDEPPATFAYALGGRVGWHVALRVRRTFDPPSTRTAALLLQQELAVEVSTGQKFGICSGVSVRVVDKQQVATAVTLSTSNWSVVEKQQVLRELPLGVPWEGCEGFRDGPLMVEALLRLRNTPDVVFVRGHGRAHPHKFGLACYVGLVLEVPTIGVEILWPEGCTHTNVLMSRKQQKRGFRCGLLHEATKELVGYELRTQDHQDFAYVSPGHRLNLDEAAQMTLRAALTFRLPEPLRRAE